MSVVARLKKKFYFVAARYFRFFANRALKRWQPRIIAITGSVGKTTMLHMVEFQLGAKAHYSHDANSAFGVAFDILGLAGIRGSKLRWIWLGLAAPVRSLYFRHTEPYYIVEIDGERPHETEFLASWLQPEATLWISLGRSHAVQFEQQVAAGQFETLDKAITHEFAMLPQYTQKKIYIDGDVPLMVKAMEKVKEHHRIPAEVIKCYKSALTKYSVRPTGADFTIDDTTFHFAAPQPRDLAIQLVMLKKLVEYLGVTLKTDFSTMPLPPGRSSYLPGRGGLKLIDSSYNAHMISMESILEMVRAMRTPHKWLILGDIVDQGSTEGVEHTRLAEVIAATRPEQVVLVGRRTHKYTAPALRKAGVKVYSTLDPHAALNYIEKHTTGKETLIFKGSQYLEWIIEMLLADPADAAKLPRREKAAVRRRQKWGLG